MWKWVIGGGLVFAALAGLLSLNIVGGPKDHRAQVRADFDRFEGAARAFRRDVGRWPSKLDDLGRCDAPGWKGPYIEGWSQFSPVRDDPWRHAYIVRALESGHGVEILTYGADGAPGGEGESADIVRNVEE